MGMQPYEVLGFTGQPPTPLNRPVQIMPYSYRGPRPKSPINLGSHLSEEH
jgi:hypothetical protein